MKYKREELKDKEKEDNLWTEWNINLSQWLIKIMMIRINSQMLDLNKKNNIWVKSKKSLDNKK